jgi:hypothetical protein
LRERDGGSVAAQLEFATMALYVSVVLLATLVAIDTSESSSAKILAIVWGTTIGLALAHFFAFRMSSRLVRGSSFHRHDFELAVAQIGGAVAVALLCSIPVVLLPMDSEVDAVRILLAMLLGIAGYASGRTGGASRPRSIVMGVFALVLGLTVALVKSLLLGH